MMYLKRYLRALKRRGVFVEEEDRGESTQTAASMLCCSLLLAAYT
jgi:hypothetical protein